MLKVTVLKTYTFQSNRLPSMLFKKIRDLLFDITFKVRMHLTAKLMNLFHILYCLTDIFIVLTEDKLSEYVRNLKTTRSNVTIFH